MTSLMSEIAEPFCGDVAAYLSAQLSIPVHFTTTENFPTRRRLLDQQQVDIAWICGLLYVAKAADPAWRYTPIVAPAMGEESKAVYFGDVIVRCDRDVKSFTDLRGASWAYNEEESFSGFQIMRALLAARGEPGPYFGRRIQSGSHLNSIELVRNSRVDTAVIDSTVMQMAVAADPSITAELHTLGRIGPYSMPPFVRSSRISSSLQREIELILRGMSTTAAGALMLARHQVNHFVAVDARRYDDIRELMRQTKHIIL